jgi:hypothetical protein
MANQYATIGPLYGSTTATTRPTNIFGNPVKTGGRVNGYAKGGGIAGPMTMSQMPLYEESYIPERIFSASPLLTGEEAEQAQKKGGNFISDALKIAALFGGKAGGGAVDQRHGYALDGGVSYPARTTEELRRIMKMREGIPVTEGLLAGANAIRNRDRQDALLSAPLNPANMGIGADGENFAHPHPPSPTTGVAPAPIAALQVTPEDNAARRAMMAKALGAREPRASERYTLPTGLVRPPVNAIKELNLGAGDPFGAFTASARAPA